jgi:signal transduction histidine kinase
MFRLVKTLLDVNAVEEASIEAPLENVNVVFVVADVVSNYEDQAAKKGIIIHFDNGATNATIRINTEIIGQIIDNLISNALKYSPEGGNVWVRIHNDNAAKPHRISVSVQDEGEGISEEEQVKLFTKFTTLSAKPTAGEDSTGLGLFIVKKLTDAAGGMIQCRSQKGYGATFTVEFPVIERVIAHDEHEE